ncbi:MAG: hypothetical protein GXO79_01365 [Chlorobi bacterium]|nr:hypothetical protein [Chlorobiota bacterium]
MLKNKFKYIPFLIGFTFLLILLIQKPLLAEDKNKKTTRISKRDNFTHDSRIRNYKLGDDHIKGAPPDPGGGGDGWPIPIGNGFGFILVGGIAYLLYKRKKTEHQNK